VSETHLYLQFLEFLRIYKVKQEVLGRTNRRLSFDTAWTRPLQQLFLAARMSLPSSYLVTIGGYTDRPTETLVQQLSYCCVYSLPRERVYRAVA
jgi:hypothetical protein